MVWTDRLTAFAVSDGAEQVIGDREWTVQSIVWAADGRTLVIAASEGSRAGSPLQLWAVSWPDGAARRITSDTNSYYQLAVSADGQAITTALVRAVGWRRADAAPPDPAPATTRRGGPASVRRRLRPDSSTS